MIIYLLLLLMGFFLGWCFGYSKSPEEELLEEEIERLKDENKRLEEALIADWQKIESTGEAEEEEDSEREDSNE